MVLSEESLKVKYRKEPFSTLEIEKGCLLTPSAKQFIADKNIELVILENGEKRIEKNNKDFSSEKTNEIPETNLKDYKYTGINGEIYLEKPDYMTQIDGNTLIMKNNKRIIFRGKIESFLSELLLNTKEFELSGADSSLIKELQTLIKLVNNILVAESLDKALEDQNLLDGKTISVVQEIARNPKEYLGKAHLLEISLENDITIHKLNRLKALARELETYAVEYFVREDKILRKDLLKAFNALSSAIYIMILKINKN